MTEVEILLARHMTRLQDDARRIWAGREREGLIEIVRAADEAACIARFAPKEPSTDTRQYIVKGATPALAAFLPAMKNQGRGLPFGPSTPEIATMVDAMLHEFGQLAGSQRLAAFERYGLATCRRIDDENIEIDVSSDGSERMDRAAGRWLMEQTRRRHQSSLGPRPDAKRISKLLDRTSSIDRGSFIR